MNQPSELQHEYTREGGLARYFVEHREVGWMALVAVLTWGCVAYFLLPQQEDPTFSGRIARVITVLPGATALKVEQLVTKRLEKKIAELETIQEISSESREGVSVISLGQRPDRASKIDQEWDKLRAKLGEADLPEGCLAPELKTDFGHIVTLLLAVTSPPHKNGTPRHSYREFEVAADKLEDELRQIASVGRIQKIGAVGEVVSLLVSPQLAHDRGLAVPQIIEALKSRNQLIPGGVFDSGQSSAPVQVAGEVRNVTDLAGTIVGMSPQGEPLHLGDVAEVHRDYENPPPLTVDVLSRPETGGKLSRQRAVLLAVEMRSGENIGEFGRQVNDAIEKVRPQLGDGIEVLTVSDQPKSVAHRIGHFSTCFAEAVVVVILIALLLMDGRAALIVAAAIPLTVAMTLGGMQAAGIPLHQISIAALIIALGMLVDDPVVAADGINRELASGRRREVASWLGPFKLRRAILFATIINIVAFLPLVLLPGDKKTFIYALPVVVTFALVASRIVSMTFIPLLGYYVLRGQRGFEQGGQIRHAFPFSLIDRTLVALLPAYRAMLEGALQRPWLTVAAAYGLLGASFLLTPLFGHQFFPPAERNQLLIDVALPESASLEQTRSVCARIVGLLNGHDEITNAAVFIGGSAPRFYYNVTPKAPGDHLAQFLINTRHAEAVPELVADLRAALDREISGARCVVKRLEQGPPMETPIQIRISGSDLDTLRHLADKAGKALRDAGAYKVHDDLGPRLPTLEIAIDQERANALGVLNAQVGLLVRATFAGVKVTELREGDHLIPVQLRLQPDEQLTRDTIPDLRVESLAGQLVPLRAFAEVKTKAEFATIGHFNRLRTVTVKAYAPGDELAADALDRARPAIDAIELPTGYRVEYAGEAKELTQSRAEMSRVMLISLSLIALAMVIQFNSLMKSVVVMLSVPLGLIGGFAGLALMHAPLGFMAMLAIVSLAGVIVSHIIVLSDFIEEARLAGMELKPALIRAGLVRMRPVLVTVLATAGGLIPLALTGGELWRPLTAVHIFGLIAATALTLFVLPVLYYLFAGKLRWMK